MAIDKIHVAEKGRNLEEEAVIPAETPVVAAAPVNQTDQTAMTYVDDGKGNIIAGPGVGIPPQAEQPVVTQPATVEQQVAFNPQTVEEAGPITKEQPAATVVADNGQGVTAPIAAQSEAVKEQDDMAQKIADVESGNAQPQQFEFNWDSGISFADVVRSSDRPKRAIIDDYVKWARATGNPINWYEINQVLGETNIDNNTHQDQVDEEKAARKAKFDALGTFFTHLGNAVGAAGWGGSVKLEDPVKLSERQREIFEKTQALRRQRNKDMMEAYMKQYNTDRQARLDATKAENEKRKLDRLDEDQRLRVRKQDWLEKYQAGILDDKAERRRIDEDYKRGMISLKERNNQIAELRALAAQMNAATSRMRENRQAGGTVTTTTDADGNVKTVEKKPAGNQGSGKRNKGKGYGSDNGKGRGY